MSSFIFLVQLCDDECVAILDKNEINILKGKTLNLKEQRNKTGVLWGIPISRPVMHCAMAIITREKTKTELIQYLHKYCFNPTPITFLKGINNGNVLTWPGFNNKEWLDHLTPSISTSQGHMNQERKNLQSTKHAKSEGGVEEDRYLHPDVETVKTHELCEIIIPFNHNIKGFSDITGAFPHN